MSCPRTRRRPPTPYGTIAETTLTSQRKDDDELLYFSPYLAGEGPAPDLAAGACRFPVARCWTRHARREELAVIAPVPPDSRRHRLLTDIAGRILAHAGASGSRIGVDGVDGAGKTTFARELATTLRSLGREVVQISADDFHQQRASRYRRGRDSAAGFWLDSYDYPALRANVLAAFGPKGTGRYREAAHDLVSDQLLDLPWRIAAPGAVLVLDGLFLHRDEMVGEWDFSVFLQVPFAVSVARMAQRDGSNPDPEHPDNARYVGGQRLYFAACLPWERASLVVDNTDLAEPRIIRG